MPEMPSHRIAMALAVLLFALETLGLRTPQYKNLLCDGCVPANVGLGIVQCLCGGCVPSGEDSDTKAHKYADCTPSSIRTSRMSLATSTLVGEKIDWDCEGPFNKKGWLETAWAVTAEWGAKQKEKLPDGDNPVISQQDPNFPDDPTKEMHRCKSSIISGEKLIEETRRGILKLTEEFVRVTNSLCEKGFSEECVKKTNSVNYMHWTDAVKLCSTFKTLLATLPAPIEPPAADALATADETFAADTCSDDSTEKWCANIKEYYQSHCTKKEDKAIGKVWCLGQESNNWQQWCPQCRRQKGPQWCSPEVLASPEVPALAELDEEDISTIAHDDKGVDGCTAPYARDHADSAPAAESA